MTAGVLRHSPRDALLVWLAAGYGVVASLFPSVPLIAIGIWWTANTVSHNFIHLPFFRSRTLNILFSAYLTVLLGVPQTLWRDRHLAHHAERKWQLRWSPQLAAELLLVVALWIGMASVATPFFLTTWLPGWLGGMLLCLLQGHFEHVRGTVSHYGAPYNALFFNDGYHVEHHARPGVHWSRLPTVAEPVADASRWPAVLRWLEVHPLDRLERLVLKSAVLQRFVVERHERAFARLLANVPQPRRVTIVGGGIFPRSLLVMRKVLPDAEVTIIDRSADNLAEAGPFLASEVRMIAADYTEAHAQDSDLLVVPLAFSGDRESFYSRPAARLTAVHDWIWRRRGSDSTIVSFLLLKRLNLVRQ